MTKTAARGLLPCRSSSRMRSLMSTLASTAMPIVSTSPAIPGSVIDAPNIASSATWSTRLKMTAMFAIIPARL